jgi:hypothetical protein
MPSCRAEASSMGLDSHGNVPFNHAKWNSAAGPCNSAEAVE